MWRIQCPFQRGQTLATGSPRLGRGRETTINRSGCHLYPTQTSLKIVTESIFLEAVCLYTDALAHWLNPALVTTALTGAGPPKLCLCGGLPVSSKLHPLTLQL